MAERQARERLQPALLDRLTNDHPDRKQEGRDARVISVRELRAAVLRDLEWLMNAGNLASLRDLDGHPLVAESVLNYGTPDLTGIHASRVEIKEVERGIRRAIQIFEPRIARQSLQVQVLLARETYGRRALTLEIQGDLWAHPLPLHLYWRAEIDLEGGAAKVEELPPPRGA